MQLITLLSSLVNRLFHVCTVLHIKQGSFPWHIAYARQYECTASTYRQVRRPKLKRKCDGPRSP